ncbi:MAG: EamA family transporter [Chitinophagales bacterium]
MWAYYSAIGLVVVSNAAYHLAQKATPAKVNPFLALSVTYLTAAMISTALLALTGGLVHLVPALKRLNWASVALGAAIVGLEMGFLLAYRAGWNISLAQVFSTIIVTLVLLPVGLIWFHEQLRAENLVGILLCLAGVLLIARR